MTSVYAKIDEDIVSADVHELDIWRESLGVGRWQLILGNKANKWGDDFHTSDVVILKIDNVELLRGYVDDVQPYLDPQGVYTNLIKVVGRDYGRDLAKLYVTASYSDTKGDDAIDDLLAKAGSEILYTSPHLAPVINMARNRTYLIDWLQDIGKRLNYDTYVSAGKTLNLFAVGAAAQHTTVDLKSIADAMTNSILKLLKGEELGFSIGNRVELSAGPLRDHYSDGNAADYDPGTSTTVVNEPMMAGAVVTNAPTSTVFKTDLPIAINDYYNGLVIEFTSGALAGEKKIISNYIGSTKRITVQSAFSEAPDVDDGFVIQGCWVGISSIKFYCIESALPSMTLDFSGAGKYGHAGLDMSLPDEMSFYVRHKCVAATASVRPRLEDAAGNIIEFKRRGKNLIGIAQKGKTEFQAHNKWHKTQIPIGDSEDNTIKNNETNNKWYYWTKIDEFDWSNVKKIKFVSAAVTGGYGNFWIDNLCIPSVEVISIGEDATSIDDYGKAMFFDQRNDIKSQIELDALRESELAKRKDPLQKIHIIASGQTGSRYAGKSLDVQAPGHGIADLTKYRIFKLHHQVRKDPITKGFDFITEYDLIKHTINPTQVVDPLRVSLADDPVGTLIAQLSLTRRRIRSAETTAREEFRDTHPATKVFYSGSGTAFPEDPEDGFVFRLTADIPSTHLAGQYQYDEATTSWIRQPATFRRATNPTYGQLEGDINENTTDGKIYQWDGDSWEFIGTSDISKLDGQATLNQLIDNIFDGVDGIAKFADDFWQGTGLDKFVDDFFSWDKITGSITGFWGAVSDRTAWLWSDITKTVGEICTTLGSWTNMVTELGNLAWAQITKTAGDICDTLVSWAGMVTELGSVAWANISGNIAAFWGAITDRASWAWGDITKTAANIMETIASWTNIITQVGNLAWANLSKTAANICDTLATWAGMVTELGSIAWTNISGTFASWKTAISDTISWVWTEISGTVASFWGAITDRANWIWDDISGNVTAFWGAITDRANWVWGDISGNIAAFWSAITDRANWAWSDISGTFAAWKTAITDTISWVYTEIGGTFAQFKTSVSDAISWTWAEVTKSGAQIMATISDWATIISQVGSLAWANLTKTASNIMATISSWANIIAQVGDLAWANLTKTASNIMTTIASWANIISQVGGLTSLQVTGVLTSWTVVTDGDALGNLAWTYVTKTAGDICDTLASWAGMVTELGSIAWTNISGTFASWKTAISDAISWAWADISGNVAAFWSAITDRASWAWGDISGTIATFWSAITDRASWAWGDITKSAAQVMATIDTWANIISEVGNLAWANLTKTATNIMDTIASWTNIINKVGSLAWANLTKTASNIMTTISSWANILSQVGGFSVAQIATALTSWATLTNVSALGELAWATITKSGAQVMDTIADWATIIAEVGDLAWANLTKTASNIMTTIASWANILTQVGGLSSIQVTAVLTSWATVIDGDGLGNLAWAYVTKTATNVMDTIASWTNIITKVGNLPWANLTKTASNIMTTISSWANIIGQVGAMSTAQITTMLTNWANVITAIGNIAWSQVTKSGAQIMATISDWATIVAETGSLAWANLTKSAANIMDTIANWSNLITDFGTMDWDKFSFDEVDGLIAGGGAVRIDDEGIHIISDDATNYLLFRKVDEAIKGAIYKDVNDYIVIHSTDGRIRMRGHTIPLANAGFDLGLASIRWHNSYIDHGNFELNLRVPVVAGSPAALANGDVWIDTTA